jgi:hypothetical protein
MIVTYLLTLPLVFLLLMVIIPYDYQLCGTKNQMLVFEGRISWLFARIAFVAKYTDMLTIDIQFKLFNMIFKLKPRANKKQSPSSPRSFFDLRWLWDRELVNGILKLLSNVYRHLKPLRFSLTGKIGLADPYYTAMVSSIAYSLNIPGLTITPIFDEELIEGEVDIQGRVIIGVLVILVIKFLLTKPVFNICKKIIQKWKGERKSCLSMKATL